MSAWLYFRFESNMKLCQVENRPAKAGTLPGSIQICLFHEEVYKWIVNSWY